MRTFKRMPADNVPKEWAPDEGEPMYVTAMKLIKKFNALAHLDAAARPAVLLALAECAPLPLHARWGAAAVALAAYGLLRLRIYFVRRAARLLEDVNPEQVKVRPVTENEEQRA